MQETQEIGWDDPLEEGMTTHSSTLAWEIPCTEKPYGLTVHGVPKSWTRLNMHADAKLTQNEFSA